MKEAESVKERKRDSDIERRRDLVANQFSKC